MAPKQVNPRWAAYAAVSAVGLIATTVAAGVSGLWVLTALPIGFLFGFFLQKGDLCGSAAFSEVILMRDGRKVWGLWVAIVVSMLGFALLARLGWVALAPKPMLWLSFLVGGIIFGVGTVLAGGCISGCLYKAGTGNLNSMAAILGIFFGIALVEYGPLQAFKGYLKTYVFKAADGAPVTFSSTTGLSFGALALILGALTAVLALVLFRRRSRKLAGVAENTAEKSGLVERALTRSWKPWQAGIAIGLLGMAAYLSSAASGRNYPLGVTHGVVYAGMLVADHDFDHVYRKAAVPVPGSAAAPAAAKSSGSKKIVWWLVGLVPCMVLGSWVAGRMSGQARLLPKPPDETIIAVGGGLFVGAGAGLADGCVIGNILSGVGLMSVGAAIFAVATVLANWAAAHFYLIGGGLSPDSLKRTFCFWKGDR